MKHMLENFIDIGCRVTFIPDNLVASQPYTRQLQEIGIEVLFGVCGVQAEIASIGTDLRLAVLSRPVIAPRYVDVIREHAPDAVIAYDTVDLHFVREGRRAALGNGRARKVASLREIELGLIRGSDVTITVTEDEREIVSSYVPGARVIVIPNANATAETVSAPTSRSGVLFVGSFEHPPNVDAAVALVRTVMPLVWQKIGPVPVKIVGPQPPQEVSELAGSTVDVMGWVKDLTPLYESARVMAAPLQYGAGMKGKVTQSLAAGLPVVTTPIGAEGLEAVDGRDMMIAEDPADLAERIVRLLEDDELWVRLSRAGQDVAARLFSPAIMRERLEELLAARAETP
jgi:glycosyltransferase involved in cell wall biosynthesis